jgi:hypothetical protein
MMYAEVPSKEKPRMPESVPFMIRMRCRFVPLNAHDGDENTAAPVIENPLRSIVTLLAGGVPF